MLDRFQAQRNIDYNEKILFYHLGFEENRERIKRQKSETLSKSNMELYINLDKETGDKGTMPAVERRVIKLDSNIPEDEDFGL